MSKPVKAGCTEMLIFFAFFRWLWDFPADGDSHTKGPLRTADSPRVTAIHVSLLNHSASGRGPSIINTILPLRPPVVWAISMVVALDAYNLRHLSSIAISHISHEQHEGRRKIRLYHSRSRRRR